MIANITKGKGFRGTLNYLLEKPRSELIGGNMLGQTAGELAGEFGISQRLNPCIEKPVFHVSLSLPYRDGYQERLDSDRWCAIAERYLDEMGFTNNQYVVVRHQDRTHDHIHIVAARGKLDKSCVSDWQDYYRTEAIVRKLEKDYNLEAVTPSWEVERRNKTKGQIQQQRRENSDPRVAVEAKSSIRAKIQDIADRVLRQVSNREEYIARMQLNGVSVMTHARQDGTVYGISYQYNHDGVGSVSTSGSKLGRGYTWTGINQRLHKEPVKALGDAIGSEQVLPSLNIGTSILKLESNHERSTSFSGTRQAEPVDVSDFRRRVGERLSTTSGKTDLPGPTSATELRATVLRLDEISERIGATSGRQQPFAPNDVRQGRQFIGVEPGTSTEAERVATKGLQPGTEFQHLSQYFELLTQGVEQLKRGNNRLKAASQSTFRVFEPAISESAPGLNRHLGILRRVSQSARTATLTLDGSPGPALEPGLTRESSQPHPLKPEVKEPLGTPSDSDNQLEPTSVVPASCENSWSQVEHFLIDQLGFPAGMVGKLHERGVLYSTLEPSGEIAAVFLKTDLEGNPSGATQRGIHPNPSETSSEFAQKEGWFKFTQGEGPLQRIAITGSALDALSLATLEQTRQKTLYLAIEGNSYPQSSLRQFALAGGKVQVALGLDQGNEKKANDLLKELHQAERLSPGKSSDWIKQLQHYRQMWQYYAQKSGVADGAGQEFPIGKLAYEEGHSKLDVAQMLFQSPALSKMQDRVGVEETRRYAGKVTKTIFGERERDQIQRRPNSRQITL